MPVVAPYPVNPLQEVCHALGLGHALAFTVTHQSCASGLLAIDIAGRLLAADAADAADEPLALILSGEKAFTRDAQMFVETTIFGEGASACLVSAFGPRDRLLSYASNVRGEFDSATGSNDARLQREYRPSLAEVMRAALDKAGVTLDDIRVVLPHNVNLVTWQRMCLLIGFPRERVVLDNIATTGHVYCADMFINQDRLCTGPAAAGREVPRRRGRPGAGRRSPRWCSSTEAIEETRDDSTGSRPGRRIPAAGG
jgi:3-oxoacyl-[acyl-carrier-protein] synthase-3